MTRFYSFKSLIDLTSYYIILYVMSFLIVSCHSRSFWHNGIMHVMTGINEHGYNSVNINHYPKTLYEFCLGRESVWICMCFFSKEVSSFNLSTAITLRKNWFHKAIAKLVWCMNITTVMATIHIFKYWCGLSTCNNGYISSCFYLSPANTLSWLYPFIMCVYIEKCREYSLFLEDRALARSPRWWNMIQYNLNLVILLRMFSMFDQSIPQLHKTPQSHMFITTF